MSPLDYERTGESVCPAQGRVRPGLTEINFIVQPVRSPAAAGRELAGQCNWVWSRLPLPPGATDS